MLDRLNGCGAHKQKIRETNKHQDNDAFSEVEHRQWTPVTVLAIQAVTSLSHFPMFYASQYRNIHLCQKKAPIYKLSRSEALKTQLICHYRHAKKTCGLFLLYNTGIETHSCNNLANLGSFAKVSVSVGSITPCTYVLCKWSCLPLQLHAHRRTQLLLGLHGTYTQKIDCLF